MTVWLASPGETKTDEDLGRNSTMKLHVKKVPRGYKLRLRRYDGQSGRVYGIKIFDLLIGISFVRAH